MKTLKTFLRGILAVFRSDPLVEPDDGLKNRRTRVARPVAGLPQLASALPVRAELRNHVITKPLRRLQRRICLNFTLFTFNSLTPSRPRIRARTSPAMLRERSSSRPYVVRICFGQD